MFEAEPAGFADIIATYDRERWMWGVREREAATMTAEFGQSTGRKAGRGADLRWEHQWLRFALCNKQ